MRQYIVSSPATQDLQAIVLFQAYPRCDRARSTTSKSPTNNQQPTPTKAFPN